MANHLKAIVLALAALLCGAGLANAQAAGPGHVKAELVAQGEAVPGGTVYVAIRQRIDAGWHTYWRNPGDAGGATEAKWTLPSGWSAGEFVWPVPERVMTGPLMNYAYTSEVLLPTPIQVPASAKPGQAAHLKADVAFLVCKDICIPQDATIALDVPVVAAQPKPDPRWADPIARTLAAAPKPAGLTAAFTRTGADIKLSVTGAALKGANLSGAYFYPYESTLIDQAKPQAVERGPKGVTLTLSPGYDFTKGKPPVELKGVLALTGASYEIDAKAGAALVGAAGLGAPPAPVKTSGMSLPTAFVFALLGGMILNLMPCVFPVLAMKGAALARHAHEPREARIQGLAYLVGVVASFLLLAGVLIAAKAAGAAIGWGYQLQSPVVVAALALLMLLVALNLSGVFEAGLSAQGVGANAVSSGGVAGAFLTGVLAVVVAAPCTAPFMAAALGYALTQNAASALLVFLGLGLGLALPFTALSFAPALLARLPRPGAWMDVLKKVLAFPMYGAAAWLGWVFAAQTGEAGLARLLAAAVVTGFAAWLYGLGQQQDGGRRRLVLQAAALPVLIVAAAVVWPAQAVTAPAGGAVAPANTSAATIASTPYSPEKLAALQGQGKAVFVDFTAAWCVTCKVNEKLVLSTREVADAFARTGTTYMVADWTSRDGTIAKTLADHGRAGVPLYLVYGKKGGEPQILPQLLTTGAVVAALDDASAAS